MEVILSVYPTILEFLESLSLSTFFEGEMIVENEKFSVEDVALNKYMFQMKLVIKHLQVSPIFINLLVKY